MFYYVAQRDIEAQKSGTRDIVKWPNEDLEEHFLWGQSIYLITMMLGKVRMDYDLFLICRIASFCFVKIFTLFFKYLVVFVLL